MGDRQSEEDEREDVQAVNRLHKPQIGLWRMLPPNLCALDGADLCLQYGYRVAGKALFKGERLERVVVYLPSSLRAWGESEAAQRGSSFSHYTRDLFMARKRQQEKAA